MAIAILGAGNVGACAALELAARGHDVDLYDENDAPIRRASFHNAGKVHLGILYAKDRTLRTAKLMLDGALAFASLLKRWVPFDADHITVSTPFLYGVHAGTMVDVDELKRHDAACTQLFADAHARTGERYLGVDRAMHVEELGRDELAALASPEHFVAMFRTTERAVDPRTVAALLRAAVLAHPRIRFIGGAEVTAVGHAPHSRLRVSFRKDGAAHSDDYVHVANTLWHGRLAIDAGMGLPPDYPWSYRYKFANRVAIPLAARDLPSITGVLGPFGDIVNYLDKGLFLSWYPTGMIGTSHALRPPDWERELTPERRLDVFKKSHAAWCARSPALAALTFDVDKVDPGGGIIFAWGDTDVDDHQSKLHERHEIGVHSVGNYHSVNTGKYTMTPLMGMKTAERILGVG